MKKILNSVKMINIHNSKQDKLLTLNFQEVNLMSKLKIIITKIESAIKDLEARNTNGDKEDNVLGEDKILLEDSFRINNLNKIIL